MRFYRDIVLGHYMPTGSAIHRIGARAKIVELIALIITIFLIREIIALAMMFFFSVWIVRQSNLPFQYVLRGMRPFIWLFLFIILAHLLVVPGRPIVPFLLISSQVALSIMFSSILTLTTSPMELAKGVFRLLSPLRILRVPVDDIAILVMISMRYVPLFLQEAERITRAQMARGVSCDEGGFVGRAKMALPVLVPLLANSLRRAHAIGDALAARGYGEGNKWPPRNGEGLGRDGYLSLAATGGVISVVMLLAFIGGSF